VVRGARTPQGARHSALRVHARTERTRDDWQTPPELLEQLRPLGPIVLDPATSSSNPTGARRWLTEREDGLRTPWQVGPTELVFLNPPYGPALPAWVRALRQASHAVALVPARPDTRWFLELRAWADALAFVVGRIRFVGAAHAAPFPSLLAYRGPRVRAFRNAVQPIAWLAPGLGPRSRQL